MNRSTLSASRQASVSAGQPTPWRMFWLTILSPGGGAATVVAVVDAVIGATDADGAVSRSSEHETDEMTTRITTTSRSRTGEV